MTEKTDEEKTKDMFRGVAAVVDALHFLVYTLTLKGKERKNILRRLENFSAFIDEEIVESIE